MSYVKSYQEQNPSRISIVIKPFEEFYGYKYKDKWIENNENRIMLYVDWKVNMMWSEKIQFVHNTIQQGFFSDNTEEILYGWCDIGYFRGRETDMPMDELKMWPSQEKLLKLDTNYIHYACVNNNIELIEMLIAFVNNRNEHGLPVRQIPAEQWSISGGFFLAKKEQLEWWKNVYYEKLHKYFEHNYLVQDDQMIVIDCMFSNLSKFVLHFEDEKYDNWFMFQRALSN